jgi:predicted transcriptional regulator of viral defense system
MLLGAEQIYAPRCGAPGWASTIAKCYTFRMAKIEDTLRELAAEQEGFFTARAAEEAGVPRVLVVQLAHRGRLTRVAQGLYRFQNWPTTRLQQYHEAVLWPRAHRPRFRA